jgi:hypothetical protein
VIKTPLGRLTPPGRAGDEIIGCRTDPLVVRLSGRVITRPVPSERGLELIDGLKVPGVRVEVPGVRVEDEIVGDWLIRSDVDTLDRGTLL